MPPQYSIEARSLSIVGGTAGHDRIDAMVFNNDRSALIAVQSALQDPGSRTAMLPIAPSQDLSMAQAAQSHEQSAQRQQAQQPPPPHHQGMEGPAQSAPQGSQAQSGLSPRAASL